jgi:uncharacterized phage protein gp47/JayE
MNTAPKPPADTRDFIQIFAQLRARAAAYTPEVQFSDGTTGAALGYIFARYIESVLQRLNQAPDKNKLAFLDMLALQLTPARQARVSVVFQLNANSASGKAPASTVVAAPPPPGSNTQIVFETEQELGVTGGKLMEVVSLWPDRDSYIDHSAAFAAGQPFTLFALPQLAGIPHHLYLSHSKLLALSGSVTLDLEIQFQRPGSVQPGLEATVNPELKILWEYWDGQVWRGFLSLDPNCQGTATAVPDSTAGMSQNGRIELRADGASSQQTAVNGANGFWIRGRVTQALPSASTQILPVIDSIRLSSIVEQPFRAALIPLALEKAKSTATASGAAVVQAGQIQLRNSAGVPIKGASVSVHLSTDPVDQLTALKENTSSAGVFELDLNRFRVVDQVVVVFFGVATGPTTIDAAHRATADAPVFPLELNMTGVAPDAALADSTKLDTTKPFYPFGQQPQPGASFYFKSQEAFSKPNAKLRVYLPLTSSPLSDISRSTNGRKPLDRQIEWEYWNGRAWAPLTPASTNEGKLDFSQTEVADFTVPEDMEITTVAGQSGLWVRARLVRGGFGYTQDIQWSAGTGGTPPVNTITYVVNQPPVLADIRLAYTWQYGPFPLERVISYNDFQYKDHTQEALWPGNTFAPYERTADVTPSLYLGFDKSPPAAQLGIFFNMQEAPGEISGPELTWEYWNGFTWDTLPSTDGTGRLRLPGIVNLISEDDSAALARFDRPFYWIRGRLKEDGPPGAPVVNGIYPNAVWASQHSTLTDQSIGLSDASTNQSFQIHQVPVLEGERIEVREVTGARANVEWRLVAVDLFGGDETVIRDLEERLGAEGAQTDIVDGDLRLRRDRFKQVTEVWVHWTPVLTLAGTGPQDRVYTIDRARGVLSFGDGQSGRIPPDGAAILGRVLRTGGGDSGNVAANTVTQILGVVPGIQAAFNPVAAEGGSDAETLSAFRDRGPQTVRHRGRAISISDYATLAREASSAVAFARAIPTHDPGGHALPGWVTVVILPNSTDPLPKPSFGLRQEVQQYLEARAPAELAAAGRIFVTVPEFLPIDVSATIAPKVASEAGDVDADARAALAAFLHPLFGGPTGNGWDLGRGVYLSDVAAALERVDRLDFIEDLELLIDGQPQGTSVAVGPTQIVVAGAIRITLTLPAGPALQ